MVFASRLPCRIVMQIKPHFPITITKWTAPSAEDTTHCQTKRLRRIVGVFEQTIDN